MATTISPNMNLPIPTVGSEPGPQYATDVNDSLTLIDQHTHLPGSGVYITPGAIDINSALTFNNNFATNLAGATFTQQTATPAPQTVYVKLGTEATPLPDLFYFDGTNTVQITAGGLVNATIASIPGESYAGGTFTWRQGTGSTLPANFDIGNVTLRPSMSVTGSTGYVTLTPSSSISTNQYNLALPLLPATNPAFLTLDTSGNMLSTVSTVGGIVNSNIANATITGSKIASSTITASNISTVNATSVIFTGVKVTNTSTTTYSGALSNLSWNGTTYGSGVSGAIYTAPATGYYQISAMITLANCAGGQQAFTWASVNGSVVTAVGYGTVVGNGQPNTITGSTGIHMNIGDNLILQMSYAYDANNRSQNGVASENWLSIQFMGQ